MLLTAYSGVFRSGYRTTCGIPDTRDIYRGILGCAYRIYDKGRSYDHCTRLSVVSASFLPGPAAVPDARVHEIVGNGHLFPRKCPGDPADGLDHDRVIFDGSSQVQPVQPRDIETFLGERVGGEQVFFSPVLICSRPFTYKH